MEDKKFEKLINLIAKIGNIELKEAFLEYQKEEKENRQKWVDNLIKKIEDVGIKKDKIISDE